MPGPVWAGICATSTANFWLQGRPKMIDSTVRRFTFESFLSMARRGLLWLVAWGPAILVMALIFHLSSQPDFGGPGWASAIARLLLGDHAIFARFPWLLSYLDAYLSWAAHFVDTRCWQSPTIGPSGANGRQIVMPCSMPGWQRSSTESVTKRTNTSSPIVNPTYATFSPTLRALRWRLRWYGT